MSLNPFNLDAATYFAVWYAPLAACYFAWPILKRRRVYVVAAATLFLTPVLGNRYSAWPVFAGVLQIVPLSAADTAAIARYLLLACLPISAVYAVAAWLMARRFIPPAGSAQSGENRPGRTRASVQRALATASPLRHMGRLLLLLVAVIAYSMTSTFTWHSLGNYILKLINSM